MTLKDCTKEELILVVKQLASHCGSNGGYYIARALSDVDMARQEKKFAEADRLLECATQKRQEYIDLLAPYVDMPAINIPASVREKAAVAARAASRAHRKWCKVMGLADK